MISKKKSDRKALSAEALTEKWNDLSPSLRHHIHQHLPARLRSMVSPEDILQEVWMEAARQCERHVRVGGLQQWLRRIALGKCTDAMRRMRYELRQRADATKSQGLGWVAGPGRTPSDFFFRAEVRAGVQRAVLTLDEPARTMLRLYYFEGASERQIAERFCLPLSVVKGVIRRARRLLRVPLGIYGLDPLRHASE